MTSRIKKLKEWIISFYKTIQPGPIASKGAARAIALTTLVIWLIASLLYFIIAPKTWFGIIPVVIVPLLAWSVGGLVLLTIKLFKAIPKSLIWIMPGAFLLLNLIYEQNGLGWKISVFVLVFAGGAGAALYTLTKKSRSQNTVRQKVIAWTGALVALTGLAWGLDWSLDTGFMPDPELNNASLRASYQPQPLELNNPAEPGSYEVGYLTYGSGKDRHRPEFGEEVNLKTDSVDGSRLIDNWKGLSGKIRTWYWGFDSQALPVNARVWYPKGTGPFPLALIVHGNHSMFDYSDPGYAYLGELLASHGIIMASVDENFINGGWTDVLSDGLEEENDARGWLLLKHLQVWRKWNSTTDHPFYQQIDLDNLAVMGHSRGGEAAAVAGFFNQLKHYPDDAKELFDFNFNIKSILSIAPVDGQYKPSGTGTPLKDVNYLVLHGSNDGDVQSFAGLRQYERVRFSDSTDFFKSAVYIYGANHGQFNTTWGNKDTPYPWASLLNTKALMPMEDQLEIGKVYVSAFLQTTLLDKRAYQPLFKDYRSGKNWLPSTIYLNQYEASDWEIIADFDEDINLNTATQAAHISSSHLTVWKEDLVGMKWGNKGTRAAFIGWDSTAYPQDTAKYAFTFNKPKSIEKKAWLSFELAESKLNSYPDKERDEKKKEELEQKENANHEENLNQTITEKEDNKKDEKNEKEKAPDPINFSIKIKDITGQEVYFDLDEYALLQPQISVDIYKNKSLQSNATSEAVYQTFFFNLNQLADLNPLFDKTSLSSIEFVFDQTKSAVIILDKVSIHP
jgi:dienelactone hydrolase